MRKNSILLKALSALLSVLLLFSACFVENFVLAANEESKIDISELSATASSELTNNGYVYSAENAIDGVVDANDNSEWHSAGSNQDEWLRIGLATAKALTKIVIHGREVVYDGVKIYINDSDTPLAENMYSQADIAYIDIPNIGAKESITTISFMDTIKDVESIKIQGYNEFRGFFVVKEIELFEMANIDYNMVPKAIWASSTYSNDVYSNATDGETTTKWHSNKGEGNRIALKLGEADSYQISAIDLFSDNRCASNTINVYALSSLPDDLSGDLGKPVATVDPAGNWKTNVNFRINFESYVEAKYIILESDGDNDGFFQINEINVTKFDPQLTLKAIWSSSTLAGYVYSNATDADTATMWHSQQGGGHRIALKLGDADSYKISAIDLLSNNRCANNTIKVYALTSLPDNLSGDLGEPVVTVDPAGKWNKNEDFRIDFEPYVEAKYIILESDGDNDGFFQINEIKVTELDPQFAPKAIWSSSTYAYFVYSDATDGDTTTKWHSDQGLGNRLALKLGDAQSYTINKIELLSDNRCSNSPINVYALETLPDNLYGDLGEPVITVDPKYKWVSNIPFAIRLIEPVSAKYIIIESDGDGDNFLQINEINVYEYHEDTELKEQGIRKVACIGDSITLGIGGDNFNAFDNGNLYPYGSSEEDGWIEDSYPAQLSEMLGDKYVVKNFGVGGRTLLSDTGLPWSATAQYGASLDWNPDIVVFMLGTNDSSPKNWKSKDNYVPEYIELINTFKALPSNPDIYVALTPTTTLNPNQNYGGITEAVILNEIIPMQIEIATRTGAYIIDNYSINQENKAELYYDGVHPNGKGYANIAANVYNEITNKSKLRIMPLGDSITDGFNSPGGYRVKLWKELVGAGLSDYVDFVGSVTDTDESLSDVLGDLNHEGHVAWSIAGGGEIGSWPGLDNYIDEWMTSYTPDIVMLQIGTNDILHKCDMETAPERLSALIDHICAKLPENGKLYVASITPIKDGTENIPNATELVNAFNQEIPTVVNAKFNEGNPVYFMDMNSLLTVDDLADGVHPNQNGYDKMGEGWFETIKNDIIDVKTDDIKASPVNTVNEKIASIDINAEDKDAQKQNIEVARIFYNALNDLQKADIVGYENLKLGEQEILGRIDPSDLDASHLVWLRKLLLTDENKPAADLNNDNEIDIRDLVCLKKILSKK